MSLVCFECKKNGSFDTLIVLVEHEGKKFQIDSKIGDFPNYYTDCVKIEDLEADSSGEFMIVKLMKSQNTWSGPEHTLLDAIQTKMVSAEQVKKLLPNIYAALSNWDDSSGFSPKGGK